MAGPGLFGFAADVATLYLAGPGLFGFAIDVATLYLAGLFGFAADGATLYLAGLACRLRRRWSYAVLGWPVGFATDGALLSVARLRSTSRIGFSMFLPENIKDVV